MVTSKKVKGRAVPMFVGVGAGVVTMLVITILLAAVVSTMVLTGRIAEVNIGYYVMGILLLGSITGALVSVLKIKRRSMMVCCVTGGIFYLILLLVTFLCFGGSYQGVGVSGIMILTGSLVSGVLGLKLNGGNMSYKK